MSKKREEFVLEDEGDEVVIRRRRKGSGNPTDPIAGCATILAVLFVIIGFVSSWISHP